MSASHPSRFTVDAVLADGEVLPTDYSYLAWLTSSGGAVWSPSPTSGLWVPADNGLLASNFDPGELITQTGLNAGRPTMVKMKVASAGTVSKLWYMVQATGTLTSGQNFVALCNAAGTVIGASADLTTAWGSTGAQSATLTAISGQSLAVNAGDVLYGMFLYNGSGSPTFAGNGRSNGPVNVNLSTSLRSWLSALTGQTAVPSAVVVSTGTGSPIVPWVAVS